MLEDFYYPHFIGGIEKKIVPKNDPSHMPEYEDFTQVKY